MFALQSLNKVENASGPGAKSANVLKGVAAIQFLGDHCSIPFAGVATALIGGAALAYAEHEKQVHGCLKCRGDRGKAARLARRSRIRAEPKFGVLLKVPLRRRNT